MLLYLLITIKKVIKFLTKHEIEGATNHYIIISVVNVPLASFILNQS